MENFLGWKQESNYVLNNNTGFPACPHLPELGPNRPQEKEMQKAKWLSEDGLRTAGKRRETKAKEKRKDTPIWMQSSKE